MTKYYSGVSGMKRFFQTGVAVLTATTVMGCGGAADSVEAEQVPGAVTDDDIGQVSQKVVWGISEQLMVDHDAWHSGGRSPTNRGQDFLIFHRNFMARMAREYRALGASSAQMAPWVGIPPELKTAALGWTPAQANAEARILSNNPPFANEDELGNLIEGTIHNWIHGAVATYFNEPAFSPIHTSPSSTYFFQVHGMVDLWWSRYLGSKILQVASAANITSNWTRLDHPALNGRPFARLMVTQNWRTRGPYNLHNVGVWYDGSRWAIYNEDRAAMPVGAAFNVQVEGGMMTQVAYPTNTFGDYMFVDHPSSHSASARFWSTHVFNTPEVSAQYNDHALGVWYNGSSWAIFNQDIASPLGAAFNVIVGTATDTSRADAAYIHTATSSNVTADYTTLTSPSLDGNPNARIIVTPNWNPTGVPGTYENHPLGVFYTGAKWAIFNEDGEAMPVNASFNVLIQR